MDSWERSLATAQYNRATCRLFHRELYTAAQVRALDRHAIEAGGIPALTLMKRAACRSLRRAAHAWPAARRIVVICGAGNNGGDGYVLARLAHAAGLERTVAASATRHRLRGDARSAFEECRAAGVQHHGRLGCARASPAATSSSTRCFGTGLDRPSTLRTARAVDRHQRQRRRRCSPSIFRAGWTPIPARVIGAAVQADAHDHFRRAQARVLSRCGTRAHAARSSSRISMCRRAPPGLVRASGRATRDASLMARVLPRRRRTAHKGEFGHVLIVGGGRRHGGRDAPRGRGRAAQRRRPRHRGDATRIMRSAISAARPELMCHGVEQASDLRPLIERRDVVAIGPGLGRDEWAHALFEAVLASDRAAGRRCRCTQPVGAKTHADATTGCSRRIRAKRRACSGSRPPRCQSDRLGSLARLTRTLRRGHGAERRRHLGRQRRDEIPALCDHGNPGMATAGMGDVLTGIDRRRCARRSRSSWDAARVGVLVHALAGDAAAAQNGERGLIASDLIARLVRMSQPVTTRADSARAAATQALGARLATLAGSMRPRRRSCIGLKGELGTGKTTFVRGVLRRARRHRSGAQPDLHVARGVRARRPCSSLISISIGCSRREEIEELGHPRAARRGLTCCSIEWPERGAVPAGCRLSRRASNTPAPDGGIAVCCGTSVAGADARVPVQSLIQVAVRLSAYPHHFY